jgi:hypothetical protein
MLSTAFDIDASENTAGKIGKKIGMLRGVLERR